MTIEDFKALAVFVDGKMVPDDPVRPEITVAEIVEGDALYGKRAHIDEELLTIWPGKSVLLFDMKRYVNGSNNLCAEISEWLDAAVTRKGWRFVLLEYRTDKGLFFVNDPNTAALFKVFFG